MKPSKRGRENSLPARASGQLTPQVGNILPLNDVRTGHEMLAGAPHKRGKIVLEV